MSLANDRFPFQVARPIAPTPFLPRAVRTRIKGQHVRAYLEYHARAFGAVGPPRLRLGVSIWYNGQVQPFGWARRMSGDGISRLAPWWYHLLRLPWWRRR